MKDALGNKVFEGDKIVFSDKEYADLCIGEIVKVNPKTLKVKGIKRAWSNKTWDTTKYPWQIAKIP